MYTVGGFGCSFVLHLLAQRPKLVLGTGLAVTLAVVTPSSVGPGTYAGAHTSLARAEEQMVFQMPQALRSVSENSLAKFDQLANERSLTLGRDGIQYVLNQCHCDDLTVEAVQKDPHLSRTVSKLYYMDLVNRYGASQASIIFEKQLMR